MLWLNKFSMFNIPDLILAYLTDIVYLYRYCSRTSYLVLPGVSYFWQSGVSYPKSSRSLVSLRAMRWKCAFWSDLSGERWSGGHHYKIVGWLLPRGRPGCRQLRDRLLSQYEHRGKSSDTRHCFPNRSHVFQQRMKQSQLKISCYDHDLFLKAKNVVWLK